MAQDLDVFFLSTADPLFRRHMACFSRLADSEYFEHADVFFLSVRDELIRKYRGCGSSPEGSASPIDASSVREQCHSATKKGKVKNNEISISKSKEKACQASSFDVQQVICAVYQNAAGFCFYHARFGTRARKCSKPCGWKL